MNFNIFIFTREMFNFITSFWTTNPPENFLEKIPKYVLYEIVNNLEFCELEKVSRLNKYFYKQLKKVEFWKARLRKQGLFPDYIPDTNFKSWYIDNIVKKMYAGTVYGRLQEFVTKRYVEAGDNAIAFIEEDGTLKSNYIKSEVVTEICTNVKAVDCGENYMAILQCNGDLYLLGSDILSEEKYKVPKRLAIDVKNISAGNYSLLIQNTHGRYYISDKKVQGFKSINVNAKKVIPFGLDYAFIDHKNNLYLQRTEAEYIASNVVSIYVHEPYIYFINKKEKLYRVQALYGDKIPKNIARSVKHVALTKNHIYVLATNADLYCVDKEHYKCLGRAQPLAKNVYTIVCNDRFAIITCVE